MNVKKNKLLFLHYGDSPYKKVAHILEEKYNLITLGFGNSSFWDIEQSHIIKYPDSNFIFNFTKFVCFFISYYI